MSFPELGSQESRRLHMDWWGKCRTCRFWNGADQIFGDNKKRLRLMPAKCENPRSTMHGEEVWSDGHCPQWDSFDIDIALEVL